MVQSRLAATMRAIVLLSVLLLCAISAEPRPNRTPPKKLSESGLYSDISTKTIASTNLMFSPQYPLWSDGARKKRWIYVPPKKTIDAKRVDDWVFPVGTKLWKEFSFGKRVETRLLEKTGRGQWSYATYAWNEDETDAVLVPEMGSPNHVEIAPGVRHTIPGVADCQSCHEGEGRDVVLGFNALQLSPDRDPNAPHAEQFTPEMVNLNSLVDRKLLINLPKRFTTDPPVVAARSPRARAALGYLSANCGGCHNSKDPLSAVGMYLKRSIGISPEASNLELESVVGHKSKYQISELGAGLSYRILPGDPSKSVIIYRMASRDPLRQMPPLGTKIVDQQALDLITTWIQEDLFIRNGENISHITKPK
jgi:hypothetical protein